MAGGLEKDIKSLFDNLPKPMIKIEINCSKIIINNFKNLVLKLY